MRPLAVLIGIVLGSTVSLALGLAMTGIVFLFLPERAARFSMEKGPLLAAIAIFSMAATVSAVSFYGELKSLRWRLFSHFALLLVLAFAVDVYWPR